MALTGGRYLKEGSAYFKIRSIDRMRCQNLICRANQSAGFYMMATLAFNELKYGFNCLKDVFSILSTQLWSSSAKINNDY